MRAQRCEGPIRPSCRPIRPPIVATARYTWPAHGTDEQWGTVPPAAATGVVGRPSQGSGEDRHGVPPQAPSDTDVIMGDGAPPPAATPMAPGGAPHTVPPREGFHEGRYGPVRDRPSAGSRMLPFSHVYNDHQLRDICALPLARLEYLQDPELPAIRQTFRNRMLSSAQERWAHLRGTTSLDDWMPFFDALNIDNEAMASLVILAQQGMAGRIELNRLLWQLVKPQAWNAPGYRDVSGYVQAAARRSFQEIHRPPDSHFDWQAWCPARALGPYWGVNLNLVPQEAAVQAAAQYGVADQITFGMVNASGLPVPPPKAPAPPGGSVAQSSAPPHPTAHQTLAGWPLTVLSSQHENGIWSTGWWRRRSDNSWQWHWQGQ